MEVAELGQLADDLLRWAMEVAATFSVWQSSPVVRRHSRSSKRSPSSWRNGWCWLPAYASSIPPPRPPPPALLEEARKVVAGYYV